VLVWEIALHGLDASRVGVVAVAGFLLPRFSAGMAGSKAGRLPTLFRSKQRRATSE